MYEMFAGKPPFKAESDLAVYEKILNGELTFSEVCQINHFHRIFQNLQRIFASVYSITTLNPAWDTAQKEGLHR